MNRDNKRALLWFVLVVMICGGGCMSVPYHPAAKGDLNWVGLDEHTRARLDGLVDPRPSDPQPNANLSGKLLLFHDTGAGRGPITAYHERWPIEAYPDQKQLERLLRLDGITHVARLDPKWPERKWDNSGEWVYPSFDSRQHLLDQARAADGDLILLYTASHDAGAVDLTLTLAQFLLLGFAPTVVASADAEIEAVLIDAHSGYIYALGTGDGADLEIANGWTRESSKRTAASEAIRSSFGDFVEQLEWAWPDLQSAY